MVLRKDPKKCFLLASLDFEKTYKMNKEVKKGILRISRTFCLINQTESSLKKIIKQKQNQNVWHMHKKLKYIIKNLIKKTSGLQAFT